MNKLIVYGAGKYAAITFAKLTEKRTSPHCFVVSDKNCNPQCLFGIPVKGIDEFISENETVTVMIGVSEKYYSEVWKHLRDLGFKNVIVPDIPNTLEYQNFCNIEEKLFLSIWYFYVTGKQLDWGRIQTFNEKIQWLKIHDSTPMKSRLADKFLVRNWVKERIGEKYLIPMLGVWDEYEEINFSKLPNKFVLKATHGCGWNIIVKNKKEFPTETAKEKFEKWMKTNYAYCYGLELHYKSIKPRIIAEEYIAELDESLYDYRFFCFNGTPRYIWVDTGSGTDNHKRCIFDLHWNFQDFKASYPFIDPLPQKPETYNEMLNCARILCRDFIFVRVDFYSVNGHVYFGEMTFTPQSGVGKWENETWNLHYGELLLLPS